MRGIFERKGTVRKVRGAGLAWASFLTNELPTLSVLKPVEFVQAVAGVQGMLIHNITCWGDGSYSSNASLIAAALVGGTPGYNVRLAYPVVAQCNGHTWRVDSPTSPSPSGSLVRLPTLCVDCYNTSSSSVLSTGVETTSSNCGLNAFYLNPCDNPCSKNSTYNSTTMARVINIVHQTLIPAPELTNVRAERVTRTGADLVLSINPSFGPV